ncbi:MAG: HigA family addiction module antitoxin [Alphaproteobacteria bacterium]|nr:HigA family addiction module antitoxin [Alphaproteobacteria bacterium]
MDVLPSLGQSRAEFAASLGVSQQALDELLAGRQPVTPVMAERLGALFGNGSEFWLAMQHNYVRTRRHRS